MTPKQEQFCREYLIDNNATQAAIRAGYSEKTANHIVSRLLSDVGIQAKIKELRAEQTKRLEYTADDVIKDFVDLKKRSKKANDRVNENRSLENLGKHYGVFEKDNEQRKPQTVINIE